jgi:hypothetical protein
MKRCKLLLFVALFALIQSCDLHQEIESIGDHQITIFEDQIVNFDPEKMDSLNRLEGIKYFTDGRIILKKVSIPEYKKEVEVLLNMRLKSNGDRWDKSGSCFIITETDKSNLLDVLNGKSEFPSDSLKYEKLKGSFLTESYEPAMELLRFMTPFGVGYYSDDRLNRKPVYIPHWEKYVEWTSDVSSIIKGEKEIWVGVWIDVWTKEGYLIDLNLDFKESKGPAHKITTYKHIPISNTVYYKGEQGYPDLFSRKDFEVTLNLPDDIENARLYYIVSGHGGHSGGDEFVKKENLIYLDDELLHSFVPWRDDCASFRRFNPGSGVWLIEDTASYLDWEDWEYKEKVIEERIASSDYSRSNWCPGSKVDPVEISIGNLSAGKHSFKFSIPESQPVNEGELNHWLISAYILYE